mgnify:FL=1
MRIWTYGDENPTTIRVPTPYYYLETMPFIAKQRNISIEEASDLQHYSIVKVRGVKHTNNITKGLSNVYEANSTDNMLRLVETGQVDIALTNTIDGILALKKLGISNVTPLKKPLAVLPLYHYLHEKHKALVPIIDQEIRRLKASGELATLIQNAENKIIKNLPLLPKRELN